jgi:6,7-dimethyl-8-ribityllumazine synthase
VPIVFGVVTADTMEQALERSRGRCNKGREAAEAGISMATLFKKMK